MNHNKAGHKKSLNFSSNLGREDKQGISLPADESPVFLRFCMKNCKLT